MAKIPVKLRLGEKLDENTEKIKALIDTAYSDIAPNLNRKPDMIILPRNPNPNDTQQNLGTFWLNSSTGAKFILTNDIPTWTPF